MTLPQENPARPISEDDRNSAVQRVQEAYAEGHISHEDMDGRLQRVLTARTHSELARLSPRSRRRTRASSTIGALGGRIKRRGAWKVPRSLKVESAYGSVLLDLSRAVFEHAAVDIELQVGTGRAKITVPRDAIVDVEGLHTGWKDLRYKAPRHSGTGGPRIRISGTMGFGRLKIRHARR